MSVTLRTVARTTLAHWFFGNLYEEVVGVPAKVAADPPGGVLAPGSPARYFLPLAPLTVGSVVALAATERSRPALVAAACTVAGAALTGRLVTTVTIDLVEGTVTDPAERARLVATWHRGNRIRLALVGAAAIALGSS